MTAARADLRGFAQNMRYYLGLRSDPPGFGRFSYMEKREYWALAWGTVIMSGTGVLLWFDNYFTKQWHLPKGMLDVMLVIHYYEAWLAFLAIVVWHLYATLFKPGVYPMNPAWLTGKMPKEMYAHEHSEGPKLAARTVRVRYEDQEEIVEGNSDAAPAPQDDQKSIPPAHPQPGDGRVSSHSRVDTPR
jgi:cytochrome b subunit of formate dehydrogenase